MGRVNAPQEIYGQKIADEVPADFHDADTFPAVFRVLYKHKKQ
jgi:hypothetical protein